MTTRKTIALTIQTFVGKARSILFNMLSRFIMRFPGHSDGKESACNVGDLGLIPGLGRSLGEGHGNSSNILAWKIPMDRGAWGLQSMGSQRAGHN